MDLKNYDNNNVFAKILRGELPYKKIYEDDFVLSFYDAFPKSSIHALIITKNPYTCLSHFHKNGSDMEILNFYKSIDKVIEKLNISDYTLLSNEGIGGGQEIPHLHIHIMSNS